MSSEFIKGLVFLVVAAFYVGLTIETKKVERRPWYLASAVFCFGVAIIL